MKTLWTTFRYTFARLRGQILGWGIGLGLFGLLVVPMYDTIGSNTAQFQQMLESYPPEFLAFFGASPETMLTPEGFMGMYAFSMLPLIIGIYAVMAGSGLIASDEEHGRLDLIIAHPVGRPSFFWGRVLALLAATFSIMIIAWLGFSILLGRSSLGITWSQMAVPFVSLSLQALIFAALALLLSLLLPSRSMAAMITGAYAAISYLVSSLAFMDEGIATLTRLLPYHYYQSVMSFGELNVGWQLGMLAITVIMALIAFLRFSRRDIRLSGEGSWLKP